MGNWDFGASDGRRDFVEVYWPLFTKLWAPWAIDYITASNM